MSQCSIYVSRGLKLFNCKFENIFDCLHSVVVFGYLRFTVERQFGKSQILLVQGIHSPAPRRAFPRRTQASSSPSQCGLEEFQRGEGRASAGGCCRQAGALQGDMKPLTHPPQRNPRPLLNLSPRRPESSSFIRPTWTRHLWFCQAQHWALGTKRGSDESCL